MSRQQDPRREDTNCHGTGILPVGFDHSVKVGKQALGRVNWGDSRELPRGAGGALTRIHSVAYSQRACEGRLQKQLLRFAMQRREQGLRRLAAINGNWVVSHTALSLA